ncbi:hypothetical protein [Streptomyces sp.]|uniref:hypothetical protein n=1 Tax=Streptomyces sp. TaxID=1931 RepID=UPI002F95B95D
MPAHAPLVTVDPVEEAVIEQAPVQLIRAEPKPPPEQFEMVLSRGGVSIDLPTMRTALTGWAVNPGVEGLDIPATELLQQRAAGQFGSYAVGVDVGAREVFLPLTLVERSLSDLLTTRSALDRLTSPYSGEPVRLTVTRPDGTTRWIEGHRSGAARRWGREDFFSAGARQSLGLLLICPDPWWHGEPITPKQWHTPESVPFFPILPVQLSSDRIFSQPRVMDIGGDVPAYPRWTVTGPATSVTATHVESGRSWTVIGNLGTGTLTVDTDPRIVSTTGMQVTGPGVTQWWGNMQPPFDLWALPPGEQTVILDIAGASPETTGQLEVTPLWETA